MGRLKGSYSRDVKLASAYIRLLPLPSTAPASAQFWTVTKYSFYLQFFLIHIRQRRKMALFVWWVFVGFFLQPSLLDFSFKS